MVVLTRWIRPGKCFIIFLWRDLIAPHVLELLASKKSLLGRSVYFATTTAFNFYSPAGRLAFLFRQFFSTTGTPDIFFSLTRHDKLPCSIKAARQRVTLLGSQAGGALLRFLGRLCILLQSTKATRRRIGGYGGMAGALVTPRSRISVCRSGVFSALSAKRLSGIL